MSNRVVTVDFGDVAPSPAVLGWAQDLLAEAVQRSVELGLERERLGYSGKSRKFTLNRVIRDSGRRYHATIKFNQRVARIHVWEVQVAG